MIGHRCKRCQWWDNQHESVKLVPVIPGKSELGFCRKHKPGAVKANGYFYGAQPVTDANEFCGEFREG